MSGVAKSVRVSSAVLPLSVSVAGPGPGPGETRINFQPRRLDGDAGALRVAAAVVHFMTADFDTIVLDPARHYSEPREVLGDTRLNAQQKRRILESWVLDAVRLSEAEAENMPGGENEQTMLREARLALLELHR